MNEQTPLPYPVAAAGVGRCVLATARLLAARRIHLPENHVGTAVSFADGTTASVYRETVVDGASTADPCMLAVAFRLRFVRGRGHALFRAESLLNTPLFVGFPGFVSKLWFAHDQNGVYRGLYDWDGPARAEHYARCLWRVLALVSESASIRYVVRPGLHVAETLANPAVIGTAEDETRAWSRPTSEAG
jgi:hypothetical protein